MGKHRILPAIGILVMAAINCNFPGATPAEAGPQNPESQPTGEQVAPAPDDSIQPAGEPVLTIQPGSGYLFASGQPVAGSDERDVWWNGVTLVPGQLIGSLGPLDDLSAVAEIHTAAITARELPPIPGEAYAMPTVDGQYVLLRVLSRGDQGEIVVEWLYPYAGAVLP